MYLYTVCTGTSTYVTVYESGLWSDHVILSSNTVSQNKSHFDFTMDQSPLYSFTALDTNLACLSTLAAKEQLLQYNLDKSFTVNKYRFNGSFVSSSASDYDQLLKDFFASTSCLTSLGAIGTPALPLDCVTDSLNLSVMNMEFFDKLKETGVFSWV